MNTKQKNAVKHVIIIGFALVCSIVYATDAHLSRKTIVVFAPLLLGIYYLGKRFISAKCQKYVLFSICYWLIVIPLINRAFVNERIAVAGSDAVVQMYPAMLYIGRTVREFFQALFTDAQFTFPMIDWALGMGENTISTLNYYGLGDPFYLLSALVTEEKLPYFFTLFYYARMYFGGLVCIAFFDELDSQRSTYAYVIGALVYSFSGFAYHSNVFIIFVHAMMYTPMMFLGAERVLKAKKKGFLFVSIFLYALSGFFFLYVSSIALVIYILYRLIIQRCKIREAIHKILELLAEYLVGLACAAFIFIPSVLGYLSSSRANNFSLDFSIMSLTEIKEFLLNIFLPQCSKTQMMGMCTIAILCIIWMLTAKKKYEHKLSMLLLFLCMIIPTISIIMSGGAVYDRWELVVILYSSYITFLMWDEIENLTWLQKLASVGIWLILIIYGGLEGILTQDNFGYTIRCFAIFLMLTCFVIPICKKWNRVVWARTVLLVIAVGSIYKSWALVACDWEIFFVRQEDVIQELIAEEEEEFYRIDYEKTLDEPRLGMNISFMLDYPGISQYFSIENSYYVNAFGEWETGESSFVNPGLDYRTVLETLTSVKYFIAHSENDFLVPYGFEKVKTSSDGAWVLYENQYTLPIAYVYDKVFEANIYKHDMNGLEKQNVLLQAAAIEDYDGTLSVISKVQNDLYQGCYTINDLQNGQIEDDVVKVEKGAVMTLTALLKADCENYLYFDDKLSVKITIDNEYIKYKEPTTLGIVAEDVEKEITIEFLEDAIFELNYMNIYHYDFEKYGDYIEQLKDNSISDIIVDTNKISCSVDTDKTKILCIAVPYDKGWQAKIDGVETKIYCMNSMFMGIEVPEGIHDVQLSYITPGLKLGIIISGIGFIIVCLYRTLR